MGIGDWGLGPIPNPQSPIPNPQSPYLMKYKSSKKIKNKNFEANFFIFKKIMFNLFQIVFSLLFNN